MLKEKISKDYITAFKEKNTVAKNLLSVIKGEIQTIEKNNGTETMSDEDVMKILNKTAKSLKETIDKTADEESKLQLVILEGYLPKQISREEIVEIVSKLVSNGVTNIGLIMKEFSNMSVDRKIVSEVIKEIIK